MLRALDDAYAILQRDTRLALEKQRASPPPPAVVTSRSPPVSATPPALVKPKPTPVTPVKAERLERVDVPEGRSPDTDVVPLSPQQLAGLLDSIHANGVPPLLPQVIDWPSGTPLPLLASGLTPPSPRSSSGACDTEGFPGPMSGRSSASYR